MCFICKCVEDAVKLLYQELFDIGKIIQNADSRVEPVVVSQGVD